MNLRKRLRDAVGSLIIALLLGGSLTMTLCDAMGLAPGFLPALLPCALTALICAVMTLGLWPFLAVMLALTAGGVSAVYFKAPFVEQIKSLVLALISDGDLMKHSSLIVAAIMLVIAVFHPIEKEMAEMRGAQKANG